MLITIVSATAFEVLRLRQMLDSNAAPDQVHFRLAGADVHFLQTGIGLTNTALHLGHYLQLMQKERQPDESHLVLHAGIAGSYRRDIPLCSVGTIISETFADLGAEMADGSFEDFFKMGLMATDEAPFEQGRIWNKAASEFAFLPQWNGLSVQRVSGTQPTIDAIRQRYPFGDVESMEGAAFFQTCQFYGVQHLAIRSISNYVEVRNRSSWRIAEAIDALCTSVFQFISMSSEQ
jgi:futalosine hydrolase